MRTPSSRRALLAAASAAVVAVVAGPVACAAPAGSAAPARAGRVVIISLDGLRPDAIDKAPAPALQALIKKGAFCPKAETIRPSVTLPSHTSMLTGLDYKRHGVTWNDYKPEKGFIELPTVFSAAKAAGRATAMFYAKIKFYHFARPGLLDFMVGDTPETGKAKGAEENSAAGLARAFAAAWPAKDYGVTFVHLREPDAAGHASGWMGPEYLKAVTEADRGVGAIVETIEKSGGFAKTALIVSADHGGSGKSHGEDKPENTTIPWICVGPGVKPGLTIARVVRTYDTAATALAFIGVAPPEGIDGKAVPEVMGE